MAEQPKSYKIFNHFMLWFLCFLLFWFLLHYVYFYLIRKEIRDITKQSEYYVEFFVQDFQGSRTSWGMYQTQIDNYTLYINVPQELFLSSEIRCFHLEFSGKVRE